MNRLAPMDYVFAGKKFLPFPTKTVEAYFPGCFVLPLKDSFCQAEKIFEALLRGFTKVVNS